MARPSRPTTLKSTAATIFTSAVAAVAIAAPWQLCGAQERVPSTARVTFRDQGWRVEVAGAYTTPLVRDANGTEVRLPVGAALSAGSSWSVATRGRLALTARATMAPVDLEDDGDTWDGGMSWSLDGIAGLEWQVHSRLWLRAGVGALLLRGPRDVLPFRDASGTHAVHPTWEAGLAARLLGARPVFASLVAQGFRLGGATIGDPIDEPGAVARLLLGVRYGR
jgi:hypothetical protein